MARRLKAVTPVWEDVPDDEDDGDVTWVAFSLSEGSKLDVKKYIRTAEMMVNPNKAGDYHVKMATARKLLTELGEGWSIEGGAIVRSLPFKMEWTYKHPIKDRQTTSFEATRARIAGLSTDVTKHFKGVHVFNMSERPEVLRPGWLYVGIPSQSQVPATAFTLYGESIKPELPTADGQVRVHNGLANPANNLDFAIYAPKTIYSRVYSSTDSGLATIIYGCLCVGAKLAMECDSGDIGINKWLESAAVQLKAKRSSEIEDAEKKLKATEAVIKGYVDSIKLQQSTMEEHRQKIAALNEKITASNVLKMFPALSNVEKINRDDPTMTVITTKDITINGVNLGPYTISIRPELAALVITGSKKPEDTIHPNLYYEGKNCIWRIGEKQQEKILECIASDKLGEATSLIVENLLTLNEDKKDFHDRLERIKNFVPAPPKRKPGRPRKVNIEDAKLDLAPAAVVDAVTDVNTSEEE